VQCTHAEAGLAAMNALLDSISTSQDPAWRFALDDVDLARAPISQLQALLATAPTPLAAAFVASAVVQRALA
jgi:hypothetical protein